ncbi:hypothetical protein TcCL_Unassigned03649 [Trypanosoma cruzi]|nr:hypothetical protein TcCL_Unassigned03649 [Trypanosoma cruzi]
MAGIVQPRQPASSTMQKVSHTHPSNGTVIPTAGTHAVASPSRHGMQANVPPSPRAFLQSTVQSLISVCAGGAEKRRSTGRHISTARGTAGWQRYVRHGPNINNHARWRHTSI